VQPAEGFRNYAAECKTMANVTKDPQSKALWLRMAERWNSCAERAEDEELRIRNKDGRQRRPKSKSYVNLKRRVAALSQG
jgi:hypothetical protein